MLLSFSPWDVHKPFLSCKACSRDDSSYSGHAKNLHFCEKQNKTINPLICMQSKCTRTNSSLSSNPRMGKAPSIISSKMDKSSSQLKCRGSSHIFFFISHQKKKKKVVWVFFIIFIFIQAEIVQSLGKIWQVNAKILWRPLILTWRSQQWRVSYLCANPKQILWLNAVFTEDNRNSFSCVWAAQQRLSWTCGRSVS